MRFHHATLTRLRSVSPPLFEWYAVNRREYLWRKLRTSPYAILVSEIMLQQTGARHVETRLPLFLKRFPTIRALAKASTADVIQAWQGLGYNRRALNLHRSAQAIVDQYANAFPATYEELLALPGIGPYTASALMVFGFAANRALVDVNIQRVLSRLWRPMKDYADIAPLQDIFALDTAILPFGQSALWHEALMDFGSTVCTKRKPRCSECPLFDRCKSGPRFLSSDHHLLTPQIESREAQLFGAPRRIWRGRTLAIIATDSPITESRLLRLIARKHELHAKEIRPLITSILDDLAREGFATRTSNILRLGS